MSAGGTLNRSLFVVVLALLQGACATSKQEGFQTIEIFGEIAEKTSTVDGLPLRSGQVVIREAASSMGFLMNLMTDDYAPFGHAGILVLEPDGAYVYDAFGRLNRRFWEPPTRRLHGPIRRLPLEVFLKRGSVSAIYEHSDIDLTTVADYAVRAHRNKLAFDGKFDYRTPELVYCNEFVAAALSSAGQVRVAPAGRTTNPSMNRVMEWLELDAPGFILSGDLVAGAIEVARIAPRLSVAQIDAHFAFERELHSRFTTDQKLGNLFRWTMRGPRLRPHLIELHKTLISGADSVENADAWAVETMVRSLTRPPRRVASR